MSNDQVVAGDAKDMDSMDPGSLKKAAVGSGIIIFGY